MEILEEAPKDIIKSSSESLDFAKKSTVKPDALSRISSNLAKKAQMMDGSLLFDPSTPTFMVSALVNKALGHLNQIKIEEQNIAVSDITIAFRILEKWLTRLEKDSAAPVFMEESLVRLRDLFVKYFNLNLPVPDFSPMPDGGVVAEWSIGDWEVSLEIDFNHGAGVYHALHHSTDEKRSALLRLIDSGRGAGDDWNYLNGCLGGFVWEDKQKSGSKLNKIELSFQG